MLNEKELETIFSVIPKGEADKARQALSKTLSNVNIGLDGEVGWIDCDADGAIIGAGQTDIGGMASRQIFDPDEEPLLKDLLEIVRAGEVKPGMISLSEHMERILWFVPATQPSFTEPTTSIVRGLTFGLDVLEAILTQFNPEAGLTKTEVKVVAHVVAGVTLAQSAQRADLSVETRRGQLKRACAKMQVTGQTGLVRLVLSQVVQLLFIISDDSKFMDVTQKYVRDYLPKDVRLEVQRLSNGKLLRVLSLGPENGTPVIAFHGLLFPMLMRAFSNRLDAYDIHLIVPIRDGYLSGGGNGSFAAGKKSANFNISDFAAYIEARFDAPVALIGHSMGSGTALKFAAKFPHLTRQTILISPFFGQASSNSSGYLNRILSILMKFRFNGIAFRFIAQQFAHSYKKKNNARAALSSIFGSSKSDADALAKENEPGAVLNWFGETFSISTSGLADDFRSITESVTEYKSVGHLRTIIGQDDPLMSVDTLSELLSTQLSNEIFVVQGAGHFLVETKADVVLGHLKEVLS